MLEDVHALSGSDKVPADKLALSGAGGTGRTGKMQATIGVDLDALPQVMQTFGAEGPTVGSGETTLAHEDWRSNPLFGFVSAAPGIAAGIAGDLGDDLGPHGGLEGFLAAVVVAILALSSGDKGQLKYRFVL